MLKFKSEPRKPMPRITYIENDGTAHRLEIRNGLSLMEGAVRNGIAGIDAECGGVCACGTCRVMIAPEWAAAVGTAKAMEAAMLELDDEARSTSRLACQIEVTALLDGLIVYVPDSQYRP